MAQSNPTTKSIDVGSMFLIDLSVNESDLVPVTNDANDIDIISTSACDDGAQIHRTSNRLPLAPMTRNGADKYQPNYSSIANADHRSLMMMDTVHRPNQLSGSLDRIASVINCDGHLRETTSNDDEHSITIVKPFDFNQENQSYSLSDESFVASNGTSLSSASYTVDSEPENEDKDSTTTREDSGVLDMKDLEGQLNNSYDNEDSGDKFHLQQNQNHDQRLEQEKPISSNIMATNLINNNNNDNNTSVTSNYNQHQLNHKNSKHSHRQVIPTEGSGNNHHNHANHHHGGSHSSKRSMSASVPIQVPVRQMRKDLNKMKLKLMKEEQTTNDQISQQNDHMDQNEQPDLRSSRRNQPEPVSSSNGFAWEMDEEDDDAFLKQEYNENHHNHYPLNDFDTDHPRAGDDPMRLFANIQALAKSLHEDAELFGSLPPKRLLESPIRSIAFV